MRLSNGHLSPLAFDPGAGARAGGVQPSLPAAGIRGASEPQHSLRLLWEAEGAGRRVGAVEVFVVHTAGDDDPALCLLLPARQELLVLRGLGSLEGRAPRCAALPAAAAAALGSRAEAGSLPPEDAWAGAQAVLLVDPGSGQLRCLTGPLLQHALAVLRADAAAAPRLDGCELGPAICGLQDVAGWEVTLADGSGAPACRVAVDVHPGTAGPRAVLALFAELAGVEAAVQLHAAWLSARGALLWLCLSCVSALRARKGVGHGRVGGTERCWLWPKQPPVPGTSLSSRPGPRALPHPTPSLLSSLP